MRSVAGIAVERIIEAIRALGRNFVSVGEINRGAAQCHMPGHGSFCQRDGGFFKKKLDAVVLRQLETQMLLARFGFFHQVERAGVGVGDIARFAENEREQGIDIALGRKRHADLQQFFEFFFGAFLIFASAQSFCG